MTVQLNPYLNFRDTARQAIEFYQSAFGGEVTISTFEDFHVSEDPAEKDKVMHSVLTSPNGLVLMCADTPDSMEHHVGSSVSVSLSGDDDAALRGYWSKLSAGASDVVPLEKAPWGDSFGMCTDKFGIRWLVNITG